MATSTWGKEKAFHRDGGNDRGRNADKPSQIPAKGWKDTLVRIKNEIDHDKLSLVSAAMSYYAFLAFVPAISAIVLMYAWISDPGEIVQHISKIGSFIPNDFQKILTEQLTSLSAKADSTLGISTIVALLLALYSASKAASAIMEAMNMVHEEKEERGFIKRNLVAIGLTFVGIIFSVVAIVVVIGLPAVMGAFNFGETIEAITGIAGWVILLTVFSVYLSVVYRFAPCRKKPKWRWVSWGAMIASVMWAAASLLFSWYASEFGNFNKTYGTLGAFVVLLMWLYISSFVILLGAEVNAELEHQTKKDTTIGKPKPMGQRNATMADTIGAAAPSRK